MSVTLSPAAPRYAVCDADDPFKKYWWAILMGIVFTALWLLTPMLGEKSVGSPAVAASKPQVDGDIEQTLASDITETFAAGAASAAGDHNNKMNLVSLLGASSGDRAIGRASAPSVNSLEGADRAIRRGTIPASARRWDAASTLAGALKKVSESGGGWGEKSHKGFNAPKLAGGSLSGISAAGGGKAGSASSGSSVFGSRNADIGLAGTQGLSASALNQVAPPVSGAAALKAAADQVQIAARNSSNDGARGSLSQVFDGSKAGSKIGGDIASLPGSYAALDAAPVNLKLDDPKLNEKKIEPPPGVDVGPSDKQDGDMAKQMAMQLAGAVIGGMIGGPVGGIVTNVIMQAVERQEAQARKVRELEEKQERDRSARRLSFKPNSSP